MRNKDTEETWPDRLTIEEFISAITENDTNEGFIQNMHHLGINNRYPEEWIKTYAAWMEMND